MTSRGDASGLQPLANARHDGKWLSSSRWPATAGSKAQRTAVPRIDQFPVAAMPVIELLDLSGST